MRIVVDADFHPALRSRLLAFSRRKECSFCMCVSAFSAAVISFFLVLVLVFFPLLPWCSKVAVLSGSNIGIHFIRSSLVFVGERKEPGGNLAS